ncbi:MAG: uroporphyrinogen decarboxylase family protein [Promethearchaeota archaeon]
MKSTVVGSFPVDNTPENFKKAFIDQIEAGITTPCYPQLVDMNHQILLPLSEILDNLEFREKEFHLSGPIDLPNAIVATEYGEQVLEILKTNPEVKNSMQGMKACLTGPFTLASNVIIESSEMVRGTRPLLFKEHRGHLFPELVRNIAEYVSRITKAYKEMGFTIISIDDPFLSQLVGRRKILFHEREFIIEAINTAVKDLGRESSLHVCGTLSPLLKDLLLETDVKHLDHEFKTCPRNFELFTRQDLESSNKVLAFGSIQTNPVPMPGRVISDYVEDIKEIESDLERAKTRFGEENLLIKPDCGFGGMRAFDRIEPGLGYTIAIKKLEVMNKAKNNVFA